MQNAGTVKTEPAFSCIYFLQGLLLHLHFKLLFLNGNPGLIQRSSHDLYEHVLLHGGSVVEALLILALIVVQCVQLVLCLHTLSDDMDTSSLAI